MYRGPIWAITELQSRWVAAIFSGLSSGTQKLDFNMEHRIRAQQPQSQFSHTDFVGHTDDSAKEILDAISSSSTSNIVKPTQFQADGSNSSAIDEGNSLCDNTNQGQFIADAIFRAFHENKWTFKRILTGKPSDGTAHGQAQFSFSNPEELLYKEQGKLILSSNIPLDITQKYLYVYDKSQDNLTVYFVDEKNQRGSIFHTINFQSKQSSDIGWIATGEHLCSQDHYSAHYLFVFNGINLSRFEITYTVKGPTKDYVSKTIFHPEKLE